MPLYYFDIDDGDQQTRDEEGAELESQMAARAEAIGVLPNIARDVVPDRDQRTFVVVVRDDSNRPIFKATLSLVAEWLTAGR